MVPHAHTLTQLRYDLRKLKAHGLLERDGKRYRYRLTARGARVALIFVPFRGRLSPSRRHHTERQRSTRRRSIKPSADKILRLGDVRCWTHGPAVFETAQLIKPPAPRGVSNFQRGRSLPGAPRSVHRGPAFGTIAGQANLARERPDGLTPRWPLASPEGWQVCVTRTESETTN